MVARRDQAVPEPDLLAVWQDFVRALQTGRLSDDRIDPYEELLRASIVDFLAALRDEALADDLNARPEIHQYLCWEQANLRGGRARLVSLGEQEALVELEPIYLRLYRASAHLQQQISLADYRQLYETVWQDRAKRAGWDLSITYVGNTTVLHFTRS